MLKTITMLLMMFSLNACRSFETKVVCEQIEQYKIEPIKACDISFQFNRCRCRCFDFNKWQALDAKMCPDFNNKVIKQIVRFTDDAGVITAKNISTKEERFQAVDFPIEHCEGLSGYNIKDAATKVRPNVKALNEVKEQLCTK